MGLWIRQRPQFIVVFLAGSVKQTKRVWFVAHCYIDGVIVKNLQKKIHKINNFVKTKIKQHYCRHVFARKLVSSVRNEQTSLKTHEKCNVHVCFATQTFAKYQLHHSTCKRHNANAPMHSHTHAHTHRNKKKETIRWKSKIGATQIPFLQHRRPQQHILQFALPFKSGTLQSHDEYYSKRSVSLAHRFAADRKRALLTTIRSEQRRSAAAAASNRRSVKSLCLQGFITGVLILAYLFTSLVLPTTVPPNSAAN